MLQNLNPQVLEGYPSRLNLLTKVIMQDNIIGIKPKLIVTNSEKITPAIRANLRKAFGVEPVNVYDCWECGNIAWECDAHEGLHINADQVYLEVAKGDQVVVDGDPGEILITDLYNQTMPLIRYAIGDIGTKKKSICSCGRKFKRNTDSFKEVEFASQRLRDRKKLKDSDFLPGPITMHHICAENRGNPPVTIPLRTIESHFMAGRPTRFIFDRLID
ncbi:hypothetical protein ACFL2E_06960 [Thermodesulfobacteriota bacterium]